MLCLKNKKFIKKIKLYIFLLKTRSFSLLYGKINLCLSILVLDYPVGVWIMNPVLKFLPTNNKRGQNLLVNGFLYKKEASFKTSTNWLCMLNDQQEKCKARCVTNNNDKSIKLGKQKHNHLPQKT